MKKVVLALVLCLTMFFALTSCSLSSLMGLSCEQAEQNLKEAGYTVTIIDGAEYVDSEDCLFPILSAAELDKYLYAEKGDDKIYIFFFYFTDQAENNSTFMSMKGMSSGMNNNALYFGTKQAVKDSKI